MRRIFENIKVMTRPIRRWHRNIVSKFIKKYCPKKYADILFENEFGYKIDWENPRDLNEKIQWLMFNTDISEWVRLADKYTVREFVKERGCEEILIPLYGKWDRAEDIDWNLLPSSFVIKTNHGSGDTRIVVNKQEEDLEKLRTYLKAALEKTYGEDSLEIHYKYIKPCIIAEQLLMPKDVELSTMRKGAAPATDYKFWCFHGRPYYVFTGSNRNVEEHTVAFNIYDIEWNRHDEWMSESYRNTVSVPKPHHFEEMCKYASKLSLGFPQVRVDLYECNDKVYFGEMTFTSLCGRMDYFAPEFLKLMGEKVHCEEAPKKKSMLLRKFRECKRTAS